MKNEELLPEKIRKYVKQHDLHRTVTSVLNELLDEMPQDPFGRLVEVFAQKAVEPPCFEQVRCTPLLNGDFFLECVIKIRGMSIRPHEGVMARELFEIEAEPAEGEEEPPQAFLDAHEFADVSLTKQIAGCSFEDAMKLHLYVQRAVSTKKHLVRPDALGGALVGHLLQAAANASNQTPLAFFQDVLGRKQLARTPRLATLDDAKGWAERWPKWVRPVLSGGGPSPVKHAQIMVALPLLTAAGAGTAPVQLHESLPPCNCIALATETGGAIREAALKAEVYKKAPPECLAEGLFAEPLEPALKTLCKAALAACADCQGVLYAHATAAYADGQYEVEEGVSMSAEELVAWYVTLVQASEDWVTCIVDPFRKEDLPAYELLHERLPQVELVCDLGPRSEATSKTKSCSVLAKYHSAPALAEQLERVGEKYLPATYVRVSDSALTSVAAMDALLAVPCGFLHAEHDGDLGTQLHELIADIR